MHGFEPPLAKEEMLNETALPPKSALPFGSKLPRKLHKQALRSALIATTVPSGLAFEQDKLARDMHHRDF